MLGNECVLSPPVEKLKQNGNSASVLASAALRKDNAAVQSTQARTGRLQTHISGSSPDSGSHVVEEIVTPDVKSHCKSKYYACPPSAGSLKHLHRTPPPRTKSIVVSNPFDVGIADRLPFPMYSPSVFARVVSPSQDSPTFRWTIEDISRIYPADIEEFPTNQFDEVVDPELESKAQEAINRFFCKNQPLLPSPWNPKPESAAALRQEINAGTLSGQHVSAVCATPGQVPLQRANSDLDLDRSSNSQKTSSREIWTQTTLTLPPILPPSMELALKPFFTFTQDQQQAQQIPDDDGVLSTSSLRRKLFFHTDSSPSPAPSTPPQHPTFHALHGSASHSLVQFQGRSFGTPLPGNSSLQSPPGISPVHSGATPMRRVKSATRLDFTRDQEDMSLDASIQNAPGTPRQTHLIAQAGACSPLGTAPLHDKEVPDEHGEHSQQPGVKWAKRNKRNSLNCSTDAMSISQTASPVKNNVSMDVSSAHNMMDISQSKPTNHTEGWREGESMADVTYQHEVNSFSYSQQAVSSNMMSQDTGYATRSSCDPAAFQSGTNSMFGLSLTRDKMGYEDSLATWPINPNVVSSTPTKTHGVRLSEYQRDTA